jgi:hypothetical protein
LDQSINDTTVCIFWYQNKKNNKRLKFSTFGIRNSYTQKRIYYHLELVLHEIKLNLISVFKQIKSKIYGQSC